MTVLIDNKQFKDKIKIYGQLMRVDKPIGTLLLLWPTYWALWIAADGQPTWCFVLLFTLGTFLMRSAGCVINDFADRNFDGSVERTKNRPFALGLVTKKEAIYLCVLLCFLAMLCLLPMNKLTWLMSIPALFLALSYPFTKRFFPIPQFVLGLAFSFGVPMAFAATQNQIPLLAWLIFFANVSWTLAYDTIYAIADKPDDLKIGIKTSAITFGDYDIAFTMGFHWLFSGLMLIVGLMINATWPFWLALIIVIILQIKQYFIIVHRDRQACFTTFLANNKIGYIWFSGIIAHYFLV